MLDGDIEAVEKFITDNSDYGPLHCAFIRIKKKAMEAHPQADNSAMDAIPALFNRWLLTVCQSESDCNVVKSFLTWAQEQHQ